MVNTIYHALLVIELNFKGINTFKCTFCHLDQLFKEIIRMCPCNFCLLPPPVTLPNVYYNNSPGIFFQ